MSVMGRLPAAAFLHESGLLFKINRDVLHPLGLALEVVKDDDGTLSMSQELQDHRASGGVCFSADSIVTGEAKLRAFLGPDCGNESRPLR